MLRVPCNTLEGFGNAIVTFVCTVQSVLAYFSSEKDEGVTPHSSSSPYLSELEFLSSICSNLKSVAGSSLTSRV